MPLPNQLNTHKSGTGLSGPYNHRSMAALAIPHSKFHILIKEKTHIVNYAGLFIVLSTDDYSSPLSMCNVFSSKQAKEQNHAKC
jgi:hypothetical protein